MSSLGFLANHPLPVEVGSVAVGPDGNLLRREKAPLHFTFEFAGTNFAADVQPTPDGVHVRLDAPLLPLPFSAEGRDRRRDVQVIVAASRAGLRHGRFVIDPQRRVHVVSELAIPTPVTPVALVTAATRMLIAATPWIDLLRRYATAGPIPARRAASKRPAPPMLSGQAG
jgi:hypothetical protein